MSWSTSLSTCSTDCSTRGSAMSDQPRSADHFVAPIKDATLTVDAVKVSAAKPRSLWSEAWHDLRKRPTFYIALLVVFIVLLMAIWPTLFTQTPPNDECFLSNSNG